MMMPDGFLNILEWRQGRRVLLSGDLPAPECTRDLFNGYLRFDRANHRDDHAFRSKILTMEGFHISTSDRLHRFHVSIAGPAIGMTRIQRAIKDQRSHVRRILRAD